jgi:5-methylthioadenosine/S-adenosylhomocysteine deaminase
MASSESCDLLVRNAYVLTVDAERRVYPAGAVAISGHDIVAVGPEAEVTAAYRADRVLDAHGALVHPGFVESHYHTGLHFTRAAISDEPHAVNPSGGTDGQIGLYSAWFNLLGEEGEYASALMSCVEMVRNGITCFLDPGTVLDTDAVAAAATAVGIRASLCDPFIWDYSADLPMADEIERAPATLERCLDTLGGELRRNADPDALVHGHVGLYGMSTFTDELAVAAKRCADEAGVVLTLHQNFEPADTEADDKRFGRPAVEHLDELGILGPSTTLAHMNVLRDGEIDALARTGSAVVWHPGNFLFYGIANDVRCRMPELAERGIPLGVMTDSAKAWSFGEMAWVGYLTARMGNDYIPPQQLLEMQTIGGARAVGLQDRIGSLEAGKRADLVIRTDRLPEAHPGMDPIRAALLVSRSKSVHTVVINGEIVVRDGRLTRVDEDVAYDLAERETARLAGALGLEAPAPWPEVR